MADEQKPLTMDDVPADVRAQLLADALRSMSAQELAGAFREAHVSAADSVNAERAAAAQADAALLQALADADAQRIREDFDAEQAVKDNHHDQPFVTKTPQGVVLLSGCI